MCLDRSAEGLRPVPKALSDPEIKSLAKNGRKTHTAAASVNERSEGSRGEGEMRLKERKKRVRPWTETERGEASPPETTGPALGVALADDVSVKYKSVDRHENKSRHRPQCVCVCNYKLQHFMNG